MGHFKWTQRRLCSLALMGGFALLSPKSGSCDRTPVVIGDDLYFCPSCSRRAPLQTPQPAQEVPGLPALADPTPPVPPFQPLALSVRFLLPVSGLCAQGPGSGSCWAVVLKTLVHPRSPGRARIGSGQADSRCRAILTDPPPPPLHRGTGRGGGGVVQGLGPVCHRLQPQQQARGGSAGAGGSRLQWRVPEGAGVSVRGRGLREGPRSL